MIRSAVPTAALAALLIAGCGGDERDAAAAQPAATAETRTATATATATPARKRATAAPRGTRLKAVSSQFGRILADGRGMAVYVFDAETSSKPECYGACARAWPPVLTRGRPVAAAGRGAHGSAPPAAATAGGR